jgi:hypothetical protein
MATISFHCPKCKYLCAFKDVYTGRRARCLNCNQIFIIPASENGKAQKVEQPEELGEPLPGFYKAVFIYSLPAIFNIRSLATLLFMFVITTLKFFTIHIDFLFFIFYLPIGTIIAVFVWGGLFWCYAEIVYSTAFDVEPLPQITLGGGFGYIWLVLKSFYSFTIAFLMVMLPAVIVKNILDFLQIPSQTAFVSLAVLGLFLFPMAVMIVSISRDLLLLFRPDYFLKPIAKAFGHYLFLAGLFILTAYLQYNSKNYAAVAGQPDLVIWKHLAAVLGIQILAIFTMRAMGLFYRHFACYFKW